MKKEKTKDYVYCGGPNAESNHPRVYIYVGQNKTATCPYCSKSLTSTVDDPYR